MRIGLLPRCLQGLGALEGAGHRSPRLRGARAGRLWMEVLWGSASHHRGMNNSQSSPTLPAPSHLHVLPRATGELSPNAATGN